MSNATTELIKKAITRAAGDKKLTVSFDELADSALDDLSVEDFLKALIKETDLIEVVCCLDMIAKESGKNIMMFHMIPKQIYPVI